MKKLFTLLTLVAVVSLHLASAQELVPMHNDNGQFGYGYKDSKKFVIKPQWDDAKPFNVFGIAVVRKGQKFGIINRQGVAIGKPMGYSIVAPYDGTDLWLVAEGGVRTDADKIKNRSTLCTYGFSGSLSYPVSGAKWGLICADGTILIEPKYQEISNIIQGSMIVVQVKNLLGIIDCKGKEILPPVYNAMTPFNDQGIASVRNAKSLKWSLINNDGRTLIGEDAGIISIMQFEDNYKHQANTMPVDTLLAHKELWFKGKHLLPITTNTNFTWINSNLPYLCVIKQKPGSKKKTDTTVYTYDVQGNCLSTEYFLHSVSDGLAYAVPYSAFAGMTEVSATKALGVYELETGTYREIENAAQRFSDLYPFHDGAALAVSADKTKYSFIDKFGQVISDQFDEISRSDDRLIVKKGAQYGLTTLSGKEIIPVSYQEICSANNGIYAVKNADDAWGYMDKEGQVLIPAEYAAGSAFVGGYAVVTKKSDKGESLSGVIDINNHVVVPIAYEKAMIGINQEEQLFAWVWQDGVYNAYDWDTGSLTPTQYVDMSISRFGTVTRDAKDRYGLISGGEEIIPCSLKSEAELESLITFMWEHDIHSVTASQARSLCIRLNPKRNSFYIYDTIDEDYWDF